MHATCALRQGGWGGGGDGRHPVVLSFDVEEHHRIEAARGLVVAEALQADYRDRMRVVTEWLLELLEKRRVLATFFVLGQVARSHPALVRDIASAGHEVASHGWDHRRVHLMDPRSFRDDLNRSLEAIEKASGRPVRGYRAPTFSIVRQTAWALDVLADSGLLYDSSIYPVRHDRYGVPDAPRDPFLARGEAGEILELPPASVRIGDWNLPIGGGGYFRLLPYPITRAALAVRRHDASCAASMLYFHPWEFDPSQPRLPLRLASRLRTYAGIARGRARLLRLLSGHTFVRAVDLAHRLLDRRDRLPGFDLAKPVLLNDPA